MPHPWALVDSSFPTFREGERPQTQIAALVDYMKILTEALKYQLENLDTNNWNATALTSFQLDTTKDVSEQVADVARQLKNMTDEVATIKNRLSTAENQLGYMEAKLEEAQRELEELRGQIGNAQADIDELQQMIRMDENGNVLIGEEGKDVHLYGNIYINGVLME